MASAELVGAARRGAEAAQQSLGQIASQLGEAESSAKKADAKAARRAKRKRDEVGSAAQQQADELAKARDEVASQVSQQADELARKRDEVIAEIQQQAEELSGRASEATQEAQTKSRRKGRKARRQATDAGQRAQTLSRRQSRKVEKAVAKAEAKSEKSGGGFTKLLALIAAAGAGYLAYTQLTNRSGARDAALDTAPDPVSGPTGPGAPPDAEIPGVPSEPVLEDRVRTTLGQDPRTSSLPRLNINVADDVVFVRGAVPADYDAEQIRVVVTEIEGVRDVDMQVGTQP